MSQVRPAVLVRPAAGAADWAAVRRLCCLTGRGGDPVPRERWPLFAEIWVGPYQRLWPGWTLVATAGPDVVGYLTGCPDTRASERRARLAVTPSLVLRLVLGRYGRGADARRALRRALGRDPGPEARLRAGLPAGFLDEYPAHLHVNVAAGWRGAGVGRRLVERHAAALAAAGVPGVHLYCGGAVAPFYVRLGFREAGRLELPGGAAVHALARPIP